MLKITTAFTVIYGASLLPNSSLETQSLYSQPE